jgi:nucleoside-specific outer membrane channel protein Tsx
MQRTFWLAAGVLAASSAARAAVDVGASAPEITAETWHNTPGKLAIRPEDLKGRILMVEFWATW